MMRVNVDTTYRCVNELGAWLALCEALGIHVQDRGCGEYLLTVPPGVSAPDPPGGPR